jgi:DNA mismatch repair protein MutS2
MMDHALRTLEYEAIRRRLAEEAACSLGIERALEMLPLTNLAQVQVLLDETSEARLMLQVKGGIPLGGVTDIRPALRQVQVGGVLDPEQLLTIASTAGAARSLKAYLSKADATTWPLLTGFIRHIGKRNRQCDGPKRYGARFRVAGPGSYSQPQTERRDALARKA